MISVAGNSTGNTTMNPSHMAPSHTAIRISTMIGCTRSPPPGLGEQVFQRCLEPRLPCEMGVELAGGEPPCGSRTRPGLQRRLGDTALAQPQDHLDEFVALLDLRAAQGRAPGAGASG